MTVIHLHIHKEVYNTMVRKTPNFRRLKAKGCEETVHGEQTNMRMFTLASNQI